MVTEAIKNLVKSYLTLTIWFIVHQEDKDLSGKQFEAVLYEIGKVEDELIKNGISELAIQKLNDYSEQLYKTPLAQHSPNAQLKICKIIFGEGARWANSG